MNIELYIGTEQLDFNESFNAVFSIGDIRDLSLGNLNRSYTLNVPLTKTNRSILKHSEIPGSTDEITNKGRLYVNKMLIIAGVITILAITADYAKVIINADDWMETMKNTNLRDIDFSDEDHELTKAVIVASWSAANAFYRYPMVNFGQLVIPVTGLQPHDWTVQDFVPMFRIIDIMEYIFAPWTIVSDWIATTYAKKLYILAPESKEDSDFIANKALEVGPNSDTDNYNRVNIAGLATDNNTLSKNPVVLDTITTDEGNDFNTGTYRYTVPEAGTYWFVFQWSNIGVGEGAFFTVNSSSYTAQILKNGAVQLAADSDSDAGGGSCIDGGTTYEMDTGYIHLETDDYITIQVSVTGNITNDDTSARWYDIRLLATNTVLTNVWTEWNRYPGKGKTITASDYMPDISAIDFIKAIKQLANLRFFADYQNQNIYIEPAQTFFAIDGETDLTSLQDNEDYTLEPISPNYNKSIILGLIEDMSDKAYTEYKEHYGLTERKTITLTSEYTKDGEQEMINDLFAHSGTGFFHEILAYGISVIKIFGDQENGDGIPYPEYRASGWTPRLVTWEGLTAGISFDIDGDTYNTYPKILAIDFNDLYDNYWITSIHRLDKNVILTIRIRLPQATINQLRTVIDDSAKEGFRTRYKLLISNQYVYGYLNKVTTDGDISECEFIIKN